MQNKYDRGVRERSRSQEKSQSSESQRERNKREDIKEESNLSHDEFDQESKRNLQSNNDLSKSRYEAERKKMEERKKRFGITDEAEKNTQKNRNISKTQYEAELKKIEERRKKFGITDESQEKTQISSKNKKRDRYDHDNDDNARYDKSSRNKQFERKNIRKNRYERDNSRNGRNQSYRENDIKYYVISREEEKELSNLKLPAALVKEFKEDPQATQNYRFLLEFDTSHPVGNPILGSTDEINELKTMITPVVDEWQKKAKFLIFDYELLDTSRSPIYADQKYNRSIVRYNKIEDLTADPEALYPVFSRAYFRLREVLSEGKILDRFKDKELCIANIAEGPGGFIHALIDFRKRQKKDLSWKGDSYYGITLRFEPDGSITSYFNWEYPKAKAYFDMLIGNDYQIKLSYGAEDGDICKTKNIEYFAEKDLNQKKCQLITADGQVGLQGDEECSAQETANAKLFFAEIITAFSIQEIGGTFVMKIYDFYSTVGLQLFAIIRAHYEKLRIIKPLTCRNSNSEKFLICEDFKGVTADKLRELKETLIKWGESQGQKEYLKNDLFLTNLTDYKLTSDSILVQDMKEFNDLVNESQKSFIQKGLELIAEKQLNDEKLIKDVKLKQRKYAELWCEKHGVPYVKNLKLSKLKPIE